MFDNFTVEVVTLDSTTLAVVILLQEVASFKTKDILLDNTSYAFIAASTYIYVCIYLFIYVHMYICAHLYIVALNCVMDFYFRGFKL